MADGIHTRYIGYASENFPVNRPIREGIDIEAYFSIYVFLEYAVDQYFVCFYHYLSSPLNHEVGIFSAKERM